MENVNIKFNHNHSFQTIQNAICEKLNTTTFTINDKPQKTWGELIGGQCKPTMNMICHGGSHCPEGAFSQLEPFIRDQIYYAIAEYMKPYLCGQCNSVEFDLNINLDIKYKNEPEI